MYKTLVVVQTYNDEEKLIYGGYNHVGFKKFK